MRAWVADPLADDAGWQQLAERPAEPDPLAEPVAVRAAVEHLAGGERVRLLRVDRDSGEPLLALPFVRTTYRRTPVPVLAGWKHEQAVRSPLLLAPGAGVEAVVAGLSALCATAGSSSLLLLRRVRLDGPAGRALLPAADGVRVEDEVHRPVVQRRPESDYLDGRLSPRSRKALRRLQRRLEEAVGGPLELVDEALAGDARGAVESFLELERSGWKGRAGSALASRDGDADFFRSVCRAFLAQGRLEAWQLRGPDGRVAAAQVNVRAGTELLHWKTAYDEALAAWSPGVQLELGLLQRFHDDPRLDLLDSGVEPGGTVSDRLYPDVQRLGDVLLPLGLRGRLLVRAVPAAYAAARAVQRRSRSLRPRAGAGRAPG